MYSSSFFDHFLIDFDPKRVPKGRHLGSQNGAKINPKIMQNRSQFSTAKKLPLVNDLGRSWVVLEGAGGAFLLIFYWFSYYFVKIDVLEEDRCPRAIRERKRAKKGPKREAKRDPRGTKNETKMTSKF